MKREDAIIYLREKLTDYAERTLQHSTGNKYNCPFCSSGTGEHKTGAFTVFPKSNRFFCFSCSEKGDIFDLIGQTENISDYNEQLKRAAELYGITIDQGDSTQSGGHMENQNQERTERKPKPTAQKSQPDTDFTSLFLQANKNLDKTDYHRGISTETLNRFKVGYIENWKHPKRYKDELSPRLIIPISKYSYTARYTRPGDFINSNGQKMNKAKVKGTERAQWTFNSGALKTATKPIIIVEGELDALSIIDVGGEAIGLGSTAYISQFLERCKETPPKQPLIIALDNDKAGQKDTDKLIDGLKQLKIECCTYNICGKYKDANEVLNADRGKFKAIIDRISQADGLDFVEFMEKEEKRAELINEAAVTAIPDFIKNIKARRKAAFYPTGFEDLDAILDGGLYAGLYIIGAISSLGKTTFCLQIADQIAQQGHDVLIFSLEMARDELIAKSISRLTAIEDLKQYGCKAHAKTTRGILNGDRWDKYSDEERAIINKAFKAYEKYAGHIYFNIGMGNIGVDQIKEKVKNFIEITGRPPVVLIDYLQILAPADMRASDKQNTDIAVSALKRICSTYSVPIVGISSFNRENYNAPVNLTSFKESGAIEYSSDVLIGLQYKGMDYQEGESEKQPARLKRIRTMLNDQIAKGRNGEAQDIQIKILKNRNGSKGDANIKFYPKFNYFTQPTPEDLELDEWESGRG